MKLELDGWKAFALILIIFILGYGFSLLTVKMLLPGFAVEANGVRQITRAVETGLSKFAAQQDARIKALEANQKK